MIIILIALVALTALTIILFWYGTKGWQNNHIFATTLGCVSSVLLVVILTFYACLSFEWFASEHKTKILNREYNTNYTREEVFWASDVIDTIRELDRKRVEINGDIMKEEK